MIHKALTRKERSTVRRFVKKQSAVSTEPAAKSPLKVDTDFAPTPYQVELALRVIVMGTSEAPQMALRMGSLVVPSIEIVRRALTMPNIGANGI